MALAVGDHAAGDADAVVVIGPWGTPTFAAGSEYFLTVRFRLREAYWWAPAGFVVAWDQLAVPAPAAPAASADATAAAWGRQGSDWTASAGGATARVDGATGNLASLRIDGRECLTAPLQPNFWRVPTDNDIGWKVPQNMRAWKTAMSDAKLPVVGAHGGRRAHRRMATAHDRDDRVARVPPARRRHAPHRGAGRDRQGHARGAADRRAVRGPGGVGRRRWFGRGPQENYRDRKTGAAVGLYQSRVGDWVTHYVSPQDNANRTDARWIEFTDTAGPAAAAGLRVAAPAGPFGVTAWPYSLADLEAAAHDVQLPRRPFVTVCIDGFQMGVGGDTSWGLPVHDEYRLKRKGEYAFGFDLSRPSPETPGR